MENLSLYDLLVGGFMLRGDDPLQGGHVLEDMPEDEKLRLSIAENLTMLLQTRRGSVMHLPDFGIPDILQVYQDAGGSLDPVRTLVRETILKYEPRISEVKVQKEFFDPNSMRISLRILATIKEANQREILLTEFSTTGWAKVLFERDTKHESRA